MTYKNLASYIGYTTRNLGPEIKETGDQTLISCYRLLLNIADAMLDQTHDDIKNIIINTDKKMAMSHLLHNPNITKEQRKSLENWVFYDKN